MRRIAFVLLFAALLPAPACGRKAPPPTAAPAASPPAVASQPTRGVDAPAAVPQSLARLVEREWPGILKEGEAFLKKYREAQNAQGGGDRAAMSPLIEEARRHCEAANDGWAKIAYWVDDQLDAGAIDEATAEACRRFLDPYERQVKEWTKKNKILKEFSTAK